MRRIEFISRLIGYLKSEFCNSLIIDFNRKGMQMNENGIGLARKILLPLGLALSLVFTGVLTMKAAVNPALGVNVKNYGAKGDGKHDDTAAFQKAMMVVSKQGGGIVYVPTGNYRILGNLNVPEDVTLKGTWIAPPNITMPKAPPTALPAPLPKHGSVLLAYAGSGKPDGTSFITLNRNSMLDGISVYYPNQSVTNPIPYPWCVHGNGDNCTIRNVLLINPYQGVDFGTTPAGRHFIDGLYGQPLFKGLFIDKCFDVGRVENVHFWPFWSTDPAIMRWTSLHGTAFIIGRTDWEYMMNCFAICYKVGYHFVQIKDGPGNVVLTQCGADEGADGTDTTPVVVDNCQGHAGISFVNGQFMGATEVQVMDSNTGPVKFTACGFWGMPNSNSVAKLAGTGNVTFEGCHFISWGHPDAQSPAIDAACQGITITSCDFMDAGKVQVRLENGCSSAIIVANRLRGGVNIENPGNVKAQIGLNSEQ